MAAGGVNDPRVAGAFALVPREDFHSPGPWPFLRWFRVDASTPSDTDDLVRRAPVSTKSTLRLPHCKHLSRMTESITGSSAP